MASRYAPPLVDFSVLSQIPDAYYQGQTRAREQAFRDQLSGGLPRGPGGEIDFAAAADMAARAGNVAAANEYARAAGSAQDRAASRAQQEREFQFRREEAGRAQRNQDRAYGLQEREFGLAQRKADPQYLQQVAEAGASKVGQQVEERRKAAVGQGMDIADPQVRAYILTGKLPREDQQPLTATDKKAILEADELVLANEAAITALNQAKAISPKAYGHMGALQRGKIDALFENEEGLATVDLDNLVTGTALGQLKAIFGAAPTEGERKILLDLQGSVSLPDKARQKIYQRAIELANKRLEFNRKRAEELRGGTFYKPSGGGKSQDQMPQGSMLPGVAAPQIIGGGLSAPAEKKRLKFNLATGEFE